MNEIKQKADALIELHSKPMPFRHPKEIIEHAVISTENIIKVVKKIKDDIGYNYDIMTINLYIYEQESILTELKSRL